MVRRPLKTEGTEEYKKGRKTRQHKLKGGREKKNIRIINNIFRCTE
jgi:hypothetical protein